MKKAIPPRTITAPRTMTAALEPDSVLLPLVCEVGLVTTWVGVLVVVGVGVGETGETPPERGLVDPLGVIGTAGAVVAVADALEVAGDTPPEPEPLAELEPLPELELPELALEAEPPDFAAAPPELEPPDLPPFLVVVAASAAPGAAPSSTSASTSARARLIALRRAAAPWPGW